VRDSHKIILEEIDRAEVKSIYLKLNKILIMSADLIIEYPQAEGGVSILRIMRWPE
jgi:hypothetical protein